MTGRGGRRCLARFFSAVLPYSLALLVGEPAGCGANGAEAEVRCTVPEDCPPTKDPCALRVCAAGACDTTRSPVDTVVSLPGLCPVRACGEGGAPVIIDAPCCGDGVCGSDESCAICPNDCPCCDGSTCIDDAPPFCGDGTCDPGETCSTCHQDCGDFCCGNGYCEVASGESCEACARDCGTCPGASCGNGKCDPDEDCSTCADCACLGLAACEGGVCQKLCPAWCDRCVLGTVQELDCPLLWDSAGDGLCDCGCQFFDGDCADPCPSPVAPLYCGSPADACCPENTVFCCPAPSCGCCGPEATGCNAAGCCE